MKTEYEIKLDKLTEQLSEMETLLENEKAALEAEKKRNAILQVRPNTYTHIYTHTHTERDRDIHTYILNNI